MPPLDLVLAGFHLLLRLAVPARPDRLRYLTYELVGQLARPAVTGQPGLLISLHMPAGGLAVRLRLLGNFPQPGSGMPGAQHLFDLVQDNLLDVIPEPSSRSNLKAPGTGSDHERGSDASGPQGCTRCCVVAAEIYRTSQARFRQVGPRTHSEQRSAHFSKRC